MWIGDWLARRAQLSPDRIALIDTTHGDEAITYRQWNEAANRTARFLRDHCGIQRGDRVAALAFNRSALLDLWFACGKIGAIFQPLNWRLTDRELSGILDDATPTVLCYDANFLPQVQTLQARESSIRQFVALDAQVAAPSDLPLTQRELLSATALTPIELGWNDPWLLCYTGGTTGLPKGAILTHGAVTWNAINTITSWGLDTDDVTILNTPLFHTGGLNVFTAPLVLAGGCSIICRSFDPEQVYTLIAERHVSLLFGVPTMFTALQQHPRWPTADFSHLKLIISGGAPCPQPIFERFWERGVDFKTGYGLTEAGPNTFWLPPAEVRTKPGAVGYPLMFIDVRVVDSNGTPCPAGSIGELQIRGPHVCAGYWNRPHETAQTFVDGWLHTGDLAQYDEDGCYWIVGRSKDVIISGGENIYPAEVESVLAGHPAVSEVALVGCADPFWGEVGCAVVALRDQQPLNAQELLSFATGKLARYKLPKRIVFRETLPKTAAGKIDKALLRAEIAEAS